MQEKMNDEWSLDSSTEEFNFEDDFGVLESSDFELIESFEDGELIKTDIDEYIEIESPDSLQAESVESKIIGSIEEKAQVAQPLVEPLADESAQIIEPSTLVEERLQEIKEEERIVAEHEAAKEKIEVPEKEAVVLKGVEPESDIVEQEEKAEELALVEAGKKEKSDKENEKSKAYQERGDETMAQTTVTREEVMKKALEKLLESSPDFEGAAVVSSDGFILASALPEASDEAKVGAMSAAILSLGERASQEMAKGKLETVFVEGEHGYVLVTAISDSVLLALATSKYAKLGLVFYELRTVKSELANSLSS